MKNKTTEAVLVWLLIIAAYIAIFFFLYYIANKNLPLL